MTSNETNTVRHFRIQGVTADGDSVYSIVVTNQDVTTTFNALDVETKTVLAITPAQITAEIFVPAGELYSENGTYAFVDVECREFGVWSNDEEMTIASLTDDVRAKLAQALLRGHI